MRKIITIIAVLGLICGCAPNVSNLTLDEELQGKSFEDRKEILRLKCLTQAERSSDIEKKKHKTHKHYSNQYLNYTQETRDLKVLCREMTNNYNTIKNK